MYRDYMRTILVTAMVALRKKATLARLAYVDLSQIMNLASQGDTIRINYVERPDVEDATISAQHPALKYAKSSKVELVLDRHKRVRWDIADADAYSTGNMQFIPTARTYGARLGDYVEADMFSALARGVSTTTGVAGTTPYSGANGIDTVVDARKALVERDADGGMLHMLNDPAAVGNLLKLADFSRADFRGSADTGQTGDLGTKFGFRFHESNNIPAISIAGAGGFAVNGAHVKGATVVAVDGVTTGVNPGELITIGGVHYAVDEGFVGAAGNLTLNEGLQAAAADDAVVARVGNHQNNWAMDPMGLAVAFRPTTAPQHTRAAYVETFTDPETGISLMLEEVRLTHGTRYYLSVLYGMKVVRPALIQRILG